MAVSDGAQLARQGIVKHLRVHSDAGVVKQENRGREVRYALQARRLQAAQAFLVRRLRKLGPRASAAVTRLLRSGKRNLKKVPGTPEG
jgi:DNA-binding transcriptional ArsR family regulator